VAKDRETLSNDFDKETVEFGGKDKVGPWQAKQGTVI
jgi:hypothetical protein